ncbi:hypothetical protein EYF80_062349 [Liparis tanakae]|uniref:Uncharacterized protein n=1 Tax=Liparis tanakae TaxID=230148 RepID=A0A4Z2EF08_9TELE|nr:hypothetical protein EYF80_062349 [Liparis tanakae]
MVGHPKAGSDATETQKVLIKEKADSSHPRDGVPKNSSLHREDNGVLMACRQQLAAAGSSVGVLRDGVNT